MQVLIADQSSTVLTFPDSEDRPCSCTFALIKSKPTSKVRGRQLLLNGEKEKKNASLYIYISWRLFNAEFGETLQKKGHYW
jgi:hypothetical protein